MDIKTINQRQYANLIDGIEGKSLMIPGGEYKIRNTKTFEDGNTMYVILEVEKNKDEETEMDNG